MALPNLVALVLLSGVVFKLARGDRQAGADHRLAGVPEPDGGPPRLARDPD